MSAPLRSIAGRLVHRGAILTPREMNVLRLIANGDTSSMIGDALGLSNRTIDVYRACILQKLNARTPAHAVALAFKCGLLELKSDHVKID